MKNFLSLQHDPGLLCYQDNSVIVPRQQADSAALSKHIGISSNSKLQIRNYKPIILPEARQTQGNNFVSDGHVYNTFCPVLLKLVDV